MALAHVHDVAQYIVRQFKEPITTMKLQKLVYLSQGWALAILGEELFDENFVAWRNGPVSRVLYSEHRGKYNIRNWRPGNPSSISNTQKLVIDAVIRNYGALTGEQLSNLSHVEGGPWDNARQVEGVREGERGSTEISKEDMKVHFRNELGLPPEGLI